MSTDTLQLPILGSFPGKGYHIIEHVNSNNSRQRGLVRVKQGVEIPHRTYQFIRGGDLQPHHQYTNALLRSARSKHFPHVGKKQLAKVAVRNHVSA